MDRHSRVELLDSRYAFYFADLVRLCGALGAADDADDISQEVLVYARTHLNEVRDPARLQGWLRTIAARRLYRLKGDRRVDQLNEEVVFAPSDPDLRMDLAAAISRLPNRERHVVTLVYGLGYSQEDAAEVLGIRRGTVGATLFHARTKLAAWLIDYESRR